MEQRDPQMASVKPSDVNTAEVVKHMEESYKNDRLDHSLQKLSSIARGESTVKCFEKDQQKIASPASDAKEDNIGHAKDEGGQPCNSQLLEALGVPKAHRHVVERFFDVLLGNASFIANERVERLAEDTEKTALMIAALDSDVKVLSKELKKAKSSLKKIQKKKSLAMKQYGEQLEEKTLLSDRLKELQESLAKEKAAAELVRREVERPCKLKEEARFLTKKSEEVRLKGMEVLQLKSELQSSKKRLKKMAEESKDRKQQIVHVKNELQECQQELSLAERKLEEETEAYKYRLALAEGRLRNAEMEILKLEMEKSKAVLGRAYEDARQHERELETAPKWHRSKFYGMNDVTRTGERNMALLCWETKSGHINQHIATSTAEFSAQIKKISAEKRLDQLPQLSVPMLLPVPQVFNATAPYGNDFRETQGRSTSADTYGSSSAVDAWEDPQNVQPNCYISQVNGASSSQISLRCWNVDGVEVELGSELPNGVAGNGDKNVHPAAGAFANEH